MLRAHNPGSVSPGPLMSGERAKTHTYVLTPMKTVAEAALATIQSAQVLRIGLWIQGWQWPCRLLRCTWSSTPSTHAICCEGAGLAAAGGKAAETAPAKKDSAWILDFDSWAQGSSGYAGVDSEMRMRLKTLYFFANRPTIGALIALGSDFGAAFSSGKPKVKSSAPC